MMRQRAAGRVGSGCGLLMLMLACRGGDVVAGAPPAARTPEPAAPPGLALTPVSMSQVCATLGKPVSLAHGLFLMDEPKLRATVAGSRGHGIELAFRYLGPTALDAKLRSGRERRQLGLELVARDTCNLLYIMWRVEPRSELVVSLKRNGAQSTHAACENRGYSRLPAALVSPLPELVPGAEHRLRAEIAGAALSVHVDGALVWRGRFDADALELSGRGGLRSDNARFEVLALNADVSPSGAPAACDENSPRRFEPID